MRPEANDDQVRRELDAIDAALAGRPVDDDLLEWAALAVAVRDERPEPDPHFAARLDARAAAGFPRRRRLLPRRPGFDLRLALPALASVLLVVVAATGTLVDTGGDEEGARPGLVTRDSAGEESSDPAGAGGGRSAGDGGGRPAAGGETSAAAPGASGGSLTAPPVPQDALSPRRGRARLIERSATLALAAPGDELDEAGNAIVRTTDRFAGVVLRSSVTAGPDGGGGHFTLRFPVARLDTALAELSRIADVRGRTQDTEDVTGSHDAAQDRLADARAERRSLRRRLARAVTADEMAALRVRLARVSREIGRAERAAARTRARARLALVEVTLTADDGGSDAGAGVWSPGDAARDALRVLQVGLGVLLIALAAAVPLALVTVPLAVALRLVARRRRIAVLDA